MLSTENVAIVIPALDEEAALRQLLPEIPQDLPVGLLSRITAALTPRQRLPARRAR